MEGWSRVLVSHILEVALGGFREIVEHRKLHGKWADSATTSDHFLVFPCLACLRPTSRRCPASFAQNRPDVDRPARKGNSNVGLRGSPSPPGAASSSCGIATSRPVPRKATLPPQTSSPGTSEAQVSSVVGRHPPTPTHQAHPPRRSLHTARFNQGACGMEL